MRRTNEPLLLPQLLLLLACLCNALLAAASQSVRSLPAIADLPPKARGIPAIVQNADDDLETTIVTYLRLPTGTTLHRRASAASARQTKLTRFDVRIMDVPVYASVVTVESDADESSVYKIYRYPEGDVMSAVMPGAQRFSSKLSADEAIVAAASAFGIRRALLYQYANEKDAHLVWHLDGDDRQQTIRLSYRASFYFATPWMERPIRPHAIVDAESGQVLSSWNGISYATTTFTGIGGNEGIWGRQTYSGLPAELVNSCTATCSLKTANWEVHNVNHSSTISTSTAWSFPCSAANGAIYDWSNGAYSPLNDAANALEISVNMFGAYLQEYPMDRVVDPSAILIARVHYGNGVGNAFWDGRYINVGDGDAINYYPFTALDVMAHEIGHSYTQHCSALMTIGQPGAINEAFSDMTGTAAKYYAFNTSDYLWGRFVPKNGSTLRNLCTPTAVPGSIDNAANWNSNTNVHNGAGVYNKAFCLLSKSPQWNVVMAFRTFAWANKGYWATSTSFSSGACGVQYAATDLYGPALAASVAPAFRAVGLTPAC